METEGGEMEFEAARCRPQLTPDFFPYLRQRIGTPAALAWAPLLLVSCHAHHSKKKGALKDLL